MKESEFLRQPSLILSFIQNSKRIMNISRLARSFKMYHGNMAKIISKLEGLNFINKIKSSNKRELRIELTKKGEKTAKHINKVVESIS